MGTLETHNSNDMQIHLQDILDLRMILLTVPYLATFLVSFDSVTFFADFDFAKVSISSDFMEQVSACSFVGLAVDAALVRAVFFLKLSVLFSFASLRPFFLISPFPF